MDLKFKPGMRRSEDIKDDATFTHLLCCIRKKQQKLDLAVPSVEDIYLAFKTIDILNQFAEGPDNED